MLLPENVIGNGLYNLWMQQGLCDVVFKSRDGSIKSHKVVLASHSPLLAKMFAKSHKEEVVTINLCSYS